MNLTVKHVTDKQAWESFMLAQPMPQFLQSWSAGELSQDLGESILRLGVYENATLIGACFVSIVRARRGTFLFAPYGPVFSTWKKEYLTALVTGLKNEGKKIGAAFIRVAPFLEQNENNLNLFRQAGLRVSPIHILAEELWVLDLAGKSEAQLLADMSKTTRYSVKRADKEHVVVTTSTSDEDIETFLRLHNMTKDRHHFVPYPDKLFIQQVKRFSPDNQTVVFTASHDQKPLASAIVMYYGSMASYHHGASTPSKIPAAYALQWAAIKEAMRRGCSIYNFWGITDLKDTKHPFYGISLFKTRFGGRELFLLPCHDYPLKPVYWMTYLLESIRRIRRGFGFRRF